MTNKIASNPVKVAWRHDETEYLSTIDLVEAEKLTPDVDGDLGASVAGLLAKQTLDLIALCQRQEAQSIPIEITAPKVLAGIFDVAISLSVRDDTAPPNARIRSLDAVRSEREVNREEVLVGTMGYRRETAAETDLAAAEWGSARLTRPEEVKFAYALMGNIYGHEIVGARNSEEERQVEHLRKLYDSAVLHGRGWPARSRTSGRIGFLASQTLEPGAEHDEAALLEAINRFGREHRILPQLARNWTPRTDLVVCFVPFDRIEEAAAISDALQTFSEPKKAPGLPR